MLKISTFHRIIINGKEVGYIQLAHYNYTEKATPHIEYKLDNEYWGKGIMTRELTKYLASIKDKFPKLIAMVERSNLASKRVLDKCGFIFMSKISDYDVFVNDLQANSEKRKIMKELVEQGYVKKIKRDLTRASIGSDNVKNFI
jgi:RimJ/RimL family protein N-acetyltransferase